MRFRLMLAVSALAIALSATLAGGQDKTDPSDDKARLAQELADLTSRAVAILEPGPLFRVEPTYPSIAKSLGRFARVQVEAQVDETGRVVDVRMRRSSPLFDQAALDAVRQWRFPPLVMDAKPLGYTVIVPISFEPQ